MNNTVLTLVLHPDTFAVCRLAPAAPLPAWATGAPFFCLVRTPEELSIVCPQAHVPPGVTHEPGWRLLGLRGPLPFALTGILHNLTAPLAAAGIAIFAFSTYDTDYLMVSATALDAALTALQEAGYAIS